MNNLTKKEQIALAILQGILSNADKNPSHADVEKHISLTQNYTQKFMEKI